VKLLEGGKTGNVHICLQYIFFLFIVDPIQVQEATESLLKGNIIAVPTDTIYGVAGLAQNSEAIERIYNIKKRQTSKPVAISVGNVADFNKYVMLYNYLSMSSLF